MSNDRGDGGRLEPTVDASSSLFSSVTDHVSTTWSHALHGNATLPEYLEVAAEGVACVAAGVAVAKLGSRAGLWGKAARADELAAGASRSEGVLGSLFRGERIGGNILGAEARLGGATAGRVGSQTEMFFRGRDSLTLGSVVNPAEVRLSESTAKISGLQEPIRLADLRGTDPISGIIAHREVTPAVGGKPVQVLELSLEHPLGGYHIQDGQAYLSVLTNDSLLAGKPATFVSPTKIMDGARQFTNETGWTPQLLQDRLLLSTNQAAPRLRWTHTTVGKFKELF